MKFSQEIEHLAKDKAEVFLASIHPDGTYKDPIYRSAASTARQISSDYGRRFLMELIQNAHDAHPPEMATGKIRITLALNEDSFGVLYVANGGTGFKREDVLALCNVGLSNKPAGEAIGNKGLGFRSVLHITDDPQVYSVAQAGSASGFDGYCFRFARDRELDQLFTDEPYRTLAGQDLPPFHLPAPLSSFPERIDKFARDGFATVIRLPLRDASAQRTAHEELDTLRNAQVPILLFLRRIASLELQVEGEPDEDFHLTRESDNINHLMDCRCPDDDEYTHVVLNDQEKYLVAWHWIPEKRVKEAISLSIERKQLNQHWAEWRGNGELAAAVRLDADILEPRLFTFLPMGKDAAAPFSGYLHGAFYPKADRTSLDADVPVNELYINEAVRLCTRAALSARRMAEHPTHLVGPNEAGRAILDLLCWKSVTSLQSTSQRPLPELVRDAFLEIGNNLADLDLFLVVPAKSGECWGSARAVWRWDGSNLRVFTTDTLATLADIPILSPSLGSERLDRLEQLLDNLDSPFNIVPSGEAVAQAVEQVALALHDLGTPMNKWREFYLDLRDLISRQKVNLHSRRILLCNDGVLRQTPPLEAQPEDSSGGDGTPTGRQPRKRSRRRAKRKDAVVFSPAKRLMGDDTTERDTESVLQLPPPLLRGFAFLSSELDWYGSLDETREALESARLVRRYDGDELVAEVSSIAQDSTTISVRRAALAWAFRLYNSSIDAHPIAMRRARLLVPTASGEWINANTAIFSTGWPPATLGNLTDGFLAQTAVHSEELRKLRGCLLASPVTKPFSRRQIEEWVEFLTAMNVMKGLQPADLGTRGFRISGHLLSASGICESLGIGPSTLALWHNEIQLSGEKQKYQGSTHELGGNLWSMPGQEYFENFSEVAKLSYAKLMVHWLATAKDDHFSCTLYASTAIYASRFSWPTPLAAFLRQAAWFPMQEAEETNSRFLEMREVWLARDESGGHLPPFMPQVPRRMRQTLLRDPATIERLSEWCGANLLGDPKYLPHQAAYLGRLFAASTVGRHHLKSFLNLYRETWITLAGTATADELSKYFSPEYLVARYLGDYAAVSIGSRGEGATVLTPGDTAVSKNVDVFVKDTDIDLAASLLEAASRYVIDMGGKYSAIASILKPVLGASFKAVSEADVELIHDDADIAENRPIVDLCPWLPTLTCLAMEKLKGASAQRLPADRREILARLNGIKTQLRDTIRFRVDDKYVRLPEAYTGAIALPSQRGQVLVIETERTALDWDTLARASRSLAQLLGHDDLAEPLQIAFRNLERLDEPVRGPIPPDNGLSYLCPELHMATHDAQRALEVMSGGIQRLVHFARPIVHYWGGGIALAAFDEETLGATTLPKVTSEIACHLAEAPHDAESVIQVCMEALSFGDIRDLLSLSFGKWNHSLLAAGEDPDLHSDAHKDAVASFIWESRDNIMDCLRSLFLVQFHRLDTLDTYVKLRGELGTVAPRDEWLIEHNVPDAGLITGLLNEWLEKHGAPCLGGDLTDLPPYSEVRQANRQRLTKLSSTYGKIMNAWCRKHQQTVPSPWQENSNVVPEQLWGMLDRKGALDFEHLDEQTLVFRLKVNGAWPEDMPVSTSLEELGLCQSDLDEEAQLEREARQERERELRSIEFNHRPIDPLEANYDALAAEIQGGFQRSTSARGLGQESKLDPAKGHQPPSHQPGGGGVGGGRRKIHPEKTEMIGFLGECTVYYWLKHLFPQKDIDAAWVSKYRSRVLPGDGNDNLGYDFVLRYRNQWWYLEVKAHMGDPREFDMGETEVRFARDCARKRGDEYRIVYVGNVQDSSAARIEILNNPLDDDYAPYFRVGGQGLRYTFKRSD